MLIRKNQKQYMRFGNWAREMARDAIGNKAKRYHCRVTTQITPTLFSQRARLLTKPPKWLWGPNAYFQALYPKVDKLE